MAWPLMPSHAPHIGQEVPADPGEIEHQETETLKRVRGGIARKPIACLQVSVRFDVEEIASNLGQVISGSLIDVLQIIVRIVRDEVIVDVERHTLKGSPPGQVCVGTALLQMLFIVQPDFFEHPLRGDHATTH